MKAVLLSKGWRLRRIHDLEALLDDASERDPGLEQFRTICQRVTGYYLIERYPLAGVVGPTVDEVSASMESARPLLQWLGARFELAAAVGPHTVDLPVPVPLGLEDDAAGRRGRRCRSRNSRRYQRCPCDRGSNGCGGCRRRGGSTADGPYETAYHKHQQIRTRVHSGAASLPEFKSLSPAALPSLHLQGCGC